MTQESVITLINDCICTETGECLCDKDVCTCDCECIECEIEYITVHKAEVCACGGNCGCASSR